MAENDPGIQEENQQTSEFQIPDEYKDKGWVRFFDGKEGEELEKEFFRSYDNSQTLIGKKVEDYIKDTDLKSLENFEEIKEALSKQIIDPVEIPEDANGYELKPLLAVENGSYPMTDETLATFGNKFKELNVPKDTAQELFKSYIDVSMKEIKKYTDADELENSLKKIFSETSQNKSKERVQVESMLKEFLPEQDRKLVETLVPNQIVEMFYKIGKGMVDKYGYKENSSPSSNPGKIRMSSADRDAEYDRLYKELVELDNTPNQKVGRRDEIVKQMRELYQ